MCNYNLHAICIIQNQMTSTTENETNKYNWYKKEPHGKKSSDFRSHADPMVKASQVTRLSLVS